MIFAREALRSNQRDQDRYGLLERIGERLAASLELQQTLRRVADTLVPQFADHCFIDLFSGEKLVRRASRHGNDWMPPPGTWAEVGETVAYPPGHPCSKALARRDAVVIEDVVAERMTAPNAASKQLGDDLGITSLISAPLLARGEVLGVMSLALSGISHRPDPHYDGFDRDLVGAIASRVALAIDNAMLFEEERETALAFQKNLLPGDRPPHLDGLDIAWRYEPARPLESHGQGIQTQVGGDWYDVIPLSAGRVGIVIGDVEGRGARAAAVMGQLRAALRAFAQDDKSPADILLKLDEWVRTMVSPGRYRELGRGLASEPVELRPPLVSCTYFVYDAWSRILSFANAGHEPPLLLLDGEVIDMESVGKGAMLGVREPGLGGEILYRGGDARAAAGHHARALHRRADRAPARRTTASTTPASRPARCCATPCARPTARTSRRSRTPPSTPCPATSTTTSRSSWSAPRRSGCRSSSARSRPSRSWSPRRAAWPPRRSRAGACSTSRPSSPACWSPRSSPTSCCTRPARPRRAASSSWRARSASTARSGSTIRGRSSPELTRREPLAKEFTLRLRRGERSVWVEVLDQDLRLPRIRRAGETDEGGRGLYLVDQLAARWGSRPTNDGKAVWFEIPLKS